ncbi:MAG: hypothetical protein KDC42_01860 [Ignavibacteriae bacterium]|nr:hypothetical protein [Ignavibacteriota bacterium]
MGLFNKFDANSPEFIALCERWDGYLKKLDDRYNDVITQAEAPMQGVVDGLQYDNIIIHNILNGLKNQTVTELSEKVDQGWNKMRAEMENLGTPWDIMSAQQKKGEQFKYKMNDDFFEYYVNTYTRAANKILENVQRHIDENKLHRCTQCGAELPIKVYSFMAVNLKCDSCGSVNTYQPDDRIRALEYYVINQLAEAKAKDLKKQARFNKDAGKDYYKAYYGFLMENVPDKKEFYERQMNERIKWLDSNPFAGDYFSF